MSSRSSTSLSARQILVVAAIVIVASFGVGLARMVWTGYSLRALAADESSRVQTLQVEIAALDRQIAAARTDDYVRTWARDVAKQTLAGEMPIVVVVPKEPSVPSAAPATVTAPETSVPRWRDLLNRFFPVR